MELPINWKSVTREEGTNLGPSFPGSDVTALRSPSRTLVLGAVSLYVQHGGFELGPDNTIRVNLQSALDAQRSLLASVWLQPGDGGLAVVATGVAADAYHVVAQSLNPRVTLTAGLMAMTNPYGAPAFALRANPRWAQAPRIGNTDNPLDPRLVMPGGNPLGVPGWGTTVVRTEATDPSGVIALVDGERLTSFTATSPVDYDVSVVVADSVVATTTVPGGQLYTLPPSVQVTGPAVLSTTATSYSVSTVR